MSAMFGMNITVSAHCLKDSERRTFPESRHRSARVRKKLIRRFGGEFVRVPAIYRVGEHWIAHPVMYAVLQRQIAPKPIYGTGNLW